jgi:hypothetical protein
LTDEVEPRIKKAFENWVEKTMKRLGLDLEFYNHNFIAICKVI